MNWCNRKLWDLFLLLLFGSTNADDSSPDSYRSLVEYKTASLITSFLHWCKYCRTLFTSVFQLMQILFTYCYSSRAPAVKYCYLPLENPCLVSLITIFLIDTLYCHYCSLTCCALAILVMRFGRNTSPNVSPMTTVMAYRTLPGSHTTISCTTTSCLLWDHQGPPMPSIMSS